MMAGGCLALGMLMGSFDAAGKSIMGTAAKPSPADAAPSHGDEEEHAPSWREERDRRRRGFFKVSSVKGRSAAVANTGTTCKGGMDLKKAVTLASTRH